MEQSKGIFTVEDVRKLTSEQFSNLSYRERLRAQQIAPSLYSGLVKQEQKRSEDICKRCGKGKDINSKPHKVIDTPSYGYSRFANSNCPTTANKLR